jgi:hypothetical protein
VDLFLTCNCRFRSSLHEEYAANDQENKMKENEQILSHKVFLRKRPLFQNEEEKGEFDVVTCCGSQAVIHDARMHPDFLSMFIDNHSYNFHAVFDEETSNEQVYNEAVKPLFDGVLRGGSTATVRNKIPELSWRPVRLVLIAMYVVLQVMLYGQTGSGKTYTITSFYQRLAEQIFPVKPASSDDPKASVRVTFVEIVGEKVKSPLTFAQLYVHTLR